MATNPATFRARHSITAAVGILGPYPGRLQDSGENLELQRPDAPDTNGLVFISVDSVRYNDRTPWPFAADGSGASLQRKAAFSFGDDPANWAAATPTPGGDFTSGPSPAIVTQPQSRAIALGQTIAFTVSAIGAAPLSYQWGFNGVAMPGAVDSNLVLPEAQLDDAGNYSVIVFNSSGSAASAIAHLTVAMPPLIVSQPTNQFVRPGATAVFGVAAAGNGPLRFQWRKDGTPIPGQTASLNLETGAAPLSIVWQRDCGSGFSDIIGANEAAYVFQPTQADSECRYRCILYTPGATATSEVATVKFVIPALTMTRNGTELTLTWAEGMLQEAEAVTGPWADVAQVTSPAHLPAGFTSRFFRLRSP